MSEGKPPTGPHGAREADGPRLPPPEAEQALLDAERLADEADWEGAAVVLGRALEDHPGDPFILCWLGVAERELGLGGIAYDRFKTVLASGLTDPLILAVAGSGVAAFDDPDAEAALRTAALLGPDLALARMMYGAYLSREGFSDDALRELEAARALDPTDPAVLYELGVALALAGEKDRAVDAFYAAAELDPDDGWTRIMLGLALLEAERIDEATEEFILGARLRPDDIEAHLLAALAAAEQHEDLAWQLLELARMNAEGVDAELAAAVEERLEDGGGSAQALLMEDFSAGAYRARLMQRP